MHGNLLRDLVRRAPPSWARWALPCVLDRSALLASLQAAATTGPGLARQLLGVEQAVCMGKPVTTTKGRWNYEPGLEAHEPWRPRLGRPGVIALPSLDLFTMGVSTSTSPLAPVRLGRRRAPSLFCGHLPGLVRHGSACACVWARDVRCLPEIGRAHV